MPPTPAAPAGTARLFPDAEGSQPRDPANTETVIARVLEDGDAEDLAWLVASHGEARLSRWLAERGPRQLSGRSRAFWSLLLAGEDAPPPATLSRELWPL